MQKIIIIFILLILSINKILAETLSFKDAVSIALENNFSIKIMKKQREIASNNVNIGAAGMLPRIDINLSGQYSNTDIELDLITGQKIKGEGNVSTTSNYGIELNWTLFDGYAMFANYDKNKQLLAKSNIELQIAIEQSIRQLANLYYTALALKRLLDFQRENIELTYERLQRVRSRAEFGTALSLEVMKAEVDLNFDSTSYLQTQLNYFNTKRAIAISLGKSANYDFEIDETPDFKLNENYDKFLELALKNNTSINKAIQERKVTEADKRLIASSIYPRISFRGGYSGSMTQSDAGFILKNMSKGFNASLVFSWNIFDGLRTNTSLQNLNILLDITDISLEQLKEQIHSAVLSAFDNYQNRLKILEMNKSNLKTAETNYQRTYELFNLGQATSLELRESQLNLLRSKNAINEAEYFAKLAEIELLLLSGTMLN